MHDATSIPPSLLDNHELITDCCRYADSLISEATVRKRHALPESVWEALGNDPEFLHAIELERLRRLRSGATKRELAQKHIVDGVPILAEIMRDPKANERHRIDAAKTLDQFSATSPDAAPVEDRFQITIVLDADHKIHIDKPISKTINPPTNTRPTFNKSSKPLHAIDAEIVDHDSDDTDTDNAQQSFCFPAIAARRNGNEGGGAAR